MRENQIQKFQANSAEIKQKAADKSADVQMERGAAYLRDKVLAGTATPAERKAYEAIGSQLAQMESSRRTAEGAAYTAGRTAAGVIGGLEGLKDAGLTLLGNTQSRMAQQYSGLDQETVNRLLDGQTEGENESWRSMARRHLAASTANDIRERLDQRYQPGAVTRFLGEAADSIGNMAPSIAANALLPGSGLAVLGASAAGQSGQEAYQNGASMEQAELYGIGSGLLEAGTEMLSGGLAGLGKGLADTALGAAVKKIGSTKAGAVVSKLSENRAVRALANSMGEGVEEVISTVLQPYLQRAVYDPSAENATAEEIVQSAILGAVVGGVFQGVNAAADSIRDQNARPAQNGLMPGAVRSEGNSGLMPGAEGVTMERPNPMLDTVDTQSAEGQKNADSTGETGHAEITDDVATSDVRRIRDLLPASMEQVRTFVQNALQKKNTRQYLKLSDASPTLVQTLAGEGIHIDGYAHVLRDNDIRHIDIRHGSQSNAKHKVTAEDISNVQNVIDHYSNLYLGYDTKAGNKTIVYEYSDGTRTFYVEEVLNAGGLSSKQMMIVGANSRPSFLKKYKKITSSVSDTSVAEQSRTTGQSPPGNHVQDAETSAGYSGGDPHGDSTPIYDPTVPQDASGVNGQDMQNGPEVSGTENGLPKGTGAAELGFDPVSNWQNQKSGFYQTGENAFRDVQMPTTDLDGRNVSRSVRTVAEAQTMPEDMAQMILEEAANGAFSFDPVTDAGAIRRAQETITSKGYDGALEYFRKNALDGVASKDLLVLGGTLLNNAANSKDGKATAEILALYASMSRAGAQTTQANRVFKKLGPQWQLYGIQQSVDNLQETLNKRYQPKGKDAPKISIDKDLVDQFLNAADQEGRNAAMEAIYQNVADQVPSTFIDKWNAWRYMAMLTNPRTHIRNIVGNIGFQPLVAAKNRVAAAIESAVDAVDKARGGKGIERSKSFAYSPSLFQAAFQDYDNAKDLMAGSKYGETFQGKINEKRRIFKNKFLEAVRTGNSAALELEDLAFKRFTYAGSLAGYLNTRGVTAEQLKSGNVNTELLDKARAYAVNEALKATYQDSNSFSDFVSQIGSSAKHSDSKTAKAASALVEGVLPFKRTPANIVVRTVEYSPLGLAKGLTIDLVKAAKRQKTASEVIDQIASGLTGSALFAAGAWLAANGILSGGSSGDDKQDEFDELNGAQSYAINFPDGTSITLDWLAPESITTFMGVEFANSLIENGEDPGNVLPALFEALGSAANPLLEMSMLQGLNDVIDSASYSDDKAAAVAYSAATGYFTQAIPTILGQAERSGQRERMTTYTSNANALPSDIQYVAGKASARLPGWDYQQIPYIDAWGRTESSGTLPTRIMDNFLNPAYVDRYSTTETDDELQRLYDAGESSVFPSRADKYFNVNGERVDLTADQYQTYATQKGQVSRSLVEEIMRTSAYQNADDAAKAKLIESVYDYANQKAKAEVSDFEPESWVKEAQKYSGGVAEYIGYKRAKSDTVEYFAMPNTKDKFEYAKRLMEDSELTPEKRTELYTSMFGGDDVPDFSSKEAFYVSSMGPKAADNWGAASQSGISIEDYYAASKAAGSGTVEEKLSSLQGLGYSEGESWWLYAMLSYDNAGELSNSEIADKVQKSINQSRKNQQKNG